MSDRKRGNQPKLSPARVAKLVHYVEKGNYFKTAAEASGIHETTAMRWRNRGEAELVRLREGNPEIDEDVAEWLEVFPDNFYADNPLWDAPVPLDFNPEEWHYVLFVHALTRAKSKAEAKAIEEIRMAGQKNWQAHAWWLERTRPAMFARQQKIEHTGSDGGPMQVQLSPEALLQRLAELKEAKEK